MNTAPSRTLALSRPGARPGTRVGAWLSRLREWGAAGWPVLLVSVIGLALRIDYAISFDGPHRGADYERHYSGVYWMIHNWRPFFYTPEVNWTINYQGPLWYMAAGVLFLIFHAEKAATSIAVVGWAVRQILLHRVLLQAIPHRRWTILLAMSIAAFLPISVDGDSIINPEGLHSSLFWVAAYFLWRMEREAQRPVGISLWTGAFFGIFAGLGALTKATSGVLPIALALMLIWQVRGARSNGDTWRTIWRHLGVPAVVAGLAWCCVAGWYCGPNIINYGHPFPHAWDLSPPPNTPEMTLPLLSRRPLGWALPFYWKHYLTEPIQQWYLFPTPNLWAQYIVGAWSDITNRGNCRLEGGGVFTKYFDGHPVSGRCLEFYSALARIGVFTTVVTIGCVFSTLWRHLRSRGAQGSLVLPLLAVLVVFFAAMFTLIYPIDGMVSTNTRYILSSAAPMSACLGIGLSEIERPLLRKILTAATGVAVTAIGVLYVYTRWGV
ncbi:MAG TPA: hypothetical protein VER11_23525 [Polyangiaceae bacterium]|nr:hypothetical protein [Polyangiaceae bacterium]